MSLQTPYQPPDETLHPASPAQILVLLAMVGLLVVASNAVAWGVLKVASPNISDVQVVRKWDLLERGGVVDTLILGDSTGNQGLDPAQLDAMIGGRSLNLCTLGNFMLVDDAWMLQRYIERHGPPRRVVLVHAANVWNRPVHPASFATIPMGLGEMGRRVPSVTFKTKQKVEFLMRRYIPIYYADQSLRLMAMRPWLVPRVRPVITERGFMPRSGAASPEVIEGDVNEAVDEYERRKFGVARVNEAALHEIVRLAESGDFPIYYVDAMVSDRLVDVPAYRQQVDALHAYLRGLGGDRIKIVLDQPIGFADEYMQDSEHITVEAAAKYTEAVGLRIMEIGAGETESKP